MTIQPSIDILKSNIALLPEKDKAFATSLVENVEKRGSASEKQAYWIKELANRALGQAKKVEADQIGDVKGIVALMNEVKGLSRPTILLETRNGMVVRLQKADKTSRNSGSIYVKERRGTGYFGKITPAGAFIAGSAPASDTIRDITAILRAFAADPAGVAASYGRESGCCCFCDRKLTDERSVKVGYGATCAKNYGLPWA